MLEMVDSSRIETCLHILNTNLAEYCAYAYPQSYNRFGQLLMLLPDLRLASRHFEDCLASVCVTFDENDSSLLSELLCHKN